MIRAFSGDYRQICEELRRRDYQTSEGNDDKGCKNVASLNVKGNYRRGPNYKQKDEILEGTPDRRDT